MLQGRYQKVRISSTPSDATALVGDKEVQTAATIDVRRKADTKIVQVHKDGYYSACRLMDWETNHFLMTLDSIPAAIPLLIDLAAGSRPGSYPDINVHLDAIPAGYPDVPLPDEHTLLEAWERQVDLCNLPSDTVQMIRLKTRYASELKRLVAQSGDTSRPYQVLGQIDVRTKGLNAWTFNMWQVYGFGNFSFKRYERKESHAGMNELLKLKALELFSEQVNAIIHVDYEDLPDNDVSATGVAIHFVDGVEPTKERSTSDRLLELKDLRDKGVISPKEYEKKRSDILNGL